MSFFEKLFQSIFFLICIPVFRIVFDYMLKKVEDFFKKKNKNALSFFYIYKNVVAFIIKYLLPIAIIFVVISIWIN